MGVNDLFSGGSRVWQLVFGLSFLLGLVLQYLYLKNLSDLLKAIRPVNRRLSPGMVWFLLLRNITPIVSALLLYTGTFSMSKYYIGVAIGYLIGIFVVVWQFFIVFKIADSIEAEYDSRNMPIEHRPSVQTGLFMAGGNAVGLLREVPGVGWLGSLGSLVAVIAWIAYWSRTYKFKKEIQHMPDHVDEDSLIFSGL